MAMTPVNRFWNLLKIYNIELRQIYIYAFFSGVVNLTLPLGIQAIINFIQTGEVTTSWVVLVIFVLLGIAVNGILQIMQQRVVENVQQDLFVRSAFEFSYRIPNINLKVLDKIYAPEIINRFFDTLTIQKGLPKILIDFSLAIFQIVFGLILLTVYSPYFIILVIAFGLTIWFIFSFVGAKGLETSLKESKYKYQLVYWLEEIARENILFKMNSSKRFHLEKTDKIVGNYIYSREKHFQVLINQFKVMVGFKVFAAALLLLLGGVLVFEEKINVGQFVAAEIIIILIINSIEKIIGSMYIIYDVLTGLEKIGFVTDLTLDNHKGQIKVDRDKAFDIKCENIQFSFTTEEDKVFENLSFHITPKSNVLLQGKTGSGKSTLLQLLAKIYVPDSGKILINDIPYSNYFWASYFDEVGLMLNFNQLFEGSIKDNIMIGRNIYDKNLYEILKILNLNDFINHLPNGVDTIINNGNRKLPKDISQKIILARTIVNLPKLLLLEEPLTELEDNEKIKIIDYLTDNERNWTLIVISNFYYWKEKCNQTIKL